MDNLFSLHSSPVFLRREALDSGYLDRDLRHATADGVIRRIRHGVYVDEAAWASASGEGRHLLLADAVVLSHEAPLALSHLSAAIAHGFQTHRQDLSKVHVLCLDDTIGRSHADVVYHHASPRRPDDMVKVDHRRVVPPTRAALEAAMLTDVRHGLVVVDSALHLGRTTIEEIRREYERVEGNRGSQSLRMTVRLARTGSESVGETLGRYLMWRHQIPEPILQHEVRDSAGALVARLDWAWPDRGLAGEFDGRDKYTRYLKSGESVVDAVMREKEREDLVRELTGFRVFRMVWSDLDHGREQQTAARLKRALSTPITLAS